jgi:hypothetical protein
MVQYNYLLMTTQNDTGLKFQTAGVDLGMGHMGPEILENNSFNTLAIL